MTTRKAQTLEQWALPAHQARSRDQRDRLLKAGERVFASRGFSESHVDEIARQAECSVGSFYRRFKDKEALFFALQTDMAEKSIAQIEQFFTSPLSLSQPLTLVIFHLIENSAKAAERISGYYRALFEMSLRGHHVWGEMRKLEILEAEKLADLFRSRGISLPHSPALIAQIAYALRMVNGVQLSVMLHGPGPYEHMDPDGIATLTRMLMRLLAIEVEENELKKIIALRRRETKKDRSGPSTAARPAKPQPDRTRTRKSATAN